MDNKMLLTITVVTAISLTASAYAAPDNSALNLDEEDIKTKSAGCAAGKCGSLKKFEEVNTVVDPQDKLVYARDGKCGVSGHSARPAKPGKCASGVCGSTE